MQDARQRGCASRPSGCPRPARRPSRQPSGAAAEETPVPRHSRPRDRAGVEYHAPKVSNFLALGSRRAFWSWQSSTLFLEPFLRWLLTATAGALVLCAFCRWFEPACRGARVPRSPSSRTVGAPDTASKLAQVVPIAITQKLIAWKQLVQDKLMPVESAPDVDLWRFDGLAQGPGGRWLLPRPRGISVTGTLVSGPARAVPRLAVQRTRTWAATASTHRHVVHRRVALCGGRPTSAMAEEAAKWLVLPADIEADHEPDGEQPKASRAHPGQPNSAQRGFRPGARHPPACAAAGQPGPG